MMILHKDTVEWLKEKIEVDLVEKSVAATDFKIYEMRVRKNPSSIKWNWFNSLLNKLGLFNNWQTP